MSNKKVTVIANDYLKDNPSEAAFQGKFGEDLPDVLNESHRILAVASLIDLASERIIRYLSETYGVNINAVTFQYFKEPEGAEYIGRSILIKEDLIERPPLKRRPSNLTFQQLEGIADENGFGEIYRLLVSELENIILKGRQEVH